jgi:hypothetical protein
LRLASTSRDKGDRKVTSAEAAAVIDAMRESFRTNPGQFQINVHSTAVGSQTTTYGGTGIQAIAQGGGLGSGPVIGFQSTADSGSPQVHIEQNRINAAIREEAEKIAAALAAIIAELKTPQPDSKKLGNWLSKLAQSFVPEIVIAAIRALLALAGIKV